MPAFSVEVPTGAIAVVPQAPIEWAGYPIPTVLSVWPNNGHLFPSDTEIEVTFSGFTPDPTSQLLLDMDGDGDYEVALTTIAVTGNSIRSSVPFTTLGGPFRGSLAPVGVSKLAWMSTDPAAIVSTWSSLVTVAWLKDKEIITDSTVTYNGNAVYTDNYAVFDGTEDTYLIMNTQIHGVAANTATPNYLMLFEFRVPNTGITINFGDSDTSTLSYNGWMLRVYTTRFDIMHGDGGSPSSGARKSVEYNFSAITDWSYTANTWHKVALYVTGLGTGKVCVNGGAVFDSTGSSGTGSSMNVQTTNSGLLGAYASDVDPDVEGTFDLRNFAILTGPFTDQEVQDLCDRPYQIYEPA